MKMNSPLLFRDAFQKYWPLLTRNWNENTQAQYKNTYNRLILVEFGDLMLTDITPEMFDGIIDHIKNEGYLKEGARKEFTDSTVKTFRRLAAQVIRHAAEDGLCVDIFWESEFVLSPEQTEKVRKGLLIPKSLTPRQAIDAFKMLTITFLEDGSSVGLLLMLTAGLRNHEACGLNYDNLRPIYEGSARYAIWVFETTEKDSNQLQLSGKTENAPPHHPASG